MRNDTRLLFNAYLAQQAALNGVQPSTVSGEKAFVAVGAMHLVPGKYKSLPQLLAERGYKVERVVAK